MLNLKFIVIATIAAFMIGSFSATYLTNKYKNAVFREQILVQEREATRILMEERERNRSVEISLAQEKDRLEIEYDNNSKKIKTLNNKYIAAVDAGKRLRDPKSKPEPNCENGVSSNTRAPTQHANNGEAGVLSAEASRFLLNEASRADQVLTDLSLCKSWVKQVQKALNKR